MNSEKGRSQARSSKGGGRKELGTWIPTSSKSPKAGSSENTPEGQKKKKMKSKKFISYSDRRK